MRRTPKRLALTCSLALAAMMLAGCAADRYHHEGLNLLEDGQFEQGIAKLAKASEAEPTNARFRMDLAVQKELQFNRWLIQAGAERSAGHLDAAETLYKRVLASDPGNARAQEGLSAVTRDRRQSPLIEQAKAAIDKKDTELATSLVDQLAEESPDRVELRELRRQIREAQAQQGREEPALKPGDAPPVSLHFNDASVRMVFEAISRSSGVNFLYDRDVRPELRTSISLNDAPVADAIELLLQTNQLQKKVLNSKTMLIYPNTPEKLKEYRELVVRAFYLSNANAKQTEAMLKGLLKLDDLYVDERLNLIVMRDTPEAIRVAEKVIAMQDVAEPEVMLEVAVMEVSRSRLTQLGIDWPDSVTVTPLSPAGKAAATVSDLQNLNRSRLGISGVSATVNLKRELTDANILANPRIRVRNKEKANILIGDKLPVLTTTATSTGFVSESVQYIDVGLKFNVEPTVYLQDEVAIKVGLEVSTVSKEITTQSGALVYQIGTRNADTILRLRDGETQVLAGLINDEDRASASRIPGLGDMPLLNRLFGSKQRSKNKTEIALSITPHVIRNIARPDAAAGEFWSGTETTLRTRPLMIQSADGSSNKGEVEGGAAQSPSLATGERLTETPPEKVELSWKGPESVKLGQLFKVSLHVKSDGGLRALPLQAFADPAAFQIVKVEEGPFFAQKDGESSFASNIDETAGKMFVGASRSGTSGVKGEDDVMTLTLKAKAAKPDAQVSLLVAKPLANADQSPNVELPAPLLIKVEE